jgi:hypothetical protein
MRIFALFLAILVAAGAANAQTSPTTGTGQANAGGAATVKSHMQLQGYKGIHDLRQMPDGQWVGKATQNGINRTVTVQPNGSTMAR